MFRDTQFNCFVPFRDYEDRKVVFYYTTECLVGLLHGSLGFCCPQLESQVLTHDVTSS